MVRMDFGDAVVGRDVKAVEVIVVGVRSRRDVMVQLINNLMVECLLIAAEIFEKHNWDLGIGTFEKEGKGGLSYFELRVKN